MTNGLSFGGHEVTLVVGLLIAGTVVGVVGVQIAGDFPNQADVEADFAAFESYCEERFGEDIVLGYASGVLGTGGLHCTAPELDSGSVERSRIPDPVLAAYARGDISAADVTASIEPRPPWESGLLQVVSVIFILVGLVGIVLSSGGSHD